MSNITSINDIKTTSVLDGWDRLRKQAAASTRTSRVKIPRGHAWLVRFLPFEMTSEGLPFAWLAQHWINNKPIYCKQYTDPAFGGDPNYLCPICDTVDAMYQQAESEEDQDKLYQCKVRESVLAYCLVFAKESEGGNCENMSEEEILVPFEFNIPKSSFALLAAKIERTKKARNSNPDIGLLDLQCGCDVWAIRDKKNSLTFDLSEDGYAPIFELDDQFEQKIVRVWRQLKRPTPKFLSDERLNAVADKIAEFAFEQASNAASDKGSGHGRGSAPRGRGNQNYNDPENDPPARGRGYANEETQEDGPSRPSARASARPAARTAPPRPSRVEAARQALEKANPAPEPESEPDPGYDPQDDQVPGAEYPSRTRPRAVTAEEPPAEEPPSVRRAAAAPARPSAAVNAARRGAAPESTRPSRPSAAASARPSRPSRGQVAEDDDDPNNMPEEQTDPAPPEDDPEMGEQPVPTRTANRTAGPTVSKNALAKALGGRIRDLAKNTEA